MLVCTAAGVLSPRRFGRSCLKVIPNASSRSLHAFISAAVEPGSVILIDGLSAHNGLDALGHTHKPTSTKGSGSHAHVSLPAAHRPHPQPTTTKTPLAQVAAERL